MQICTCYQADVQTHESGSKFCKKCGHWWDTRYGSREPTEEPRLPVVSISTQPGPPDWVHKKTPAPTVVRVRHPETKDPYRSCECGSGKKSKFCCRK